MPVNLQNYLFTAIIFLTASGCQKNSAKTTTQTITVQQDNVPAWLAIKIAAFQNEKPANPPIKIYSYTYQNQEVYYISGRSGDIPAELYNRQGEQLCQPDGGITGRGDGKCPDFMESRSNEKLIWEDTRN